MSSFPIRFKRYLCCCLALLAVSSQSGCAWFRNHSEISGALSNYWGWRAEQARFAEAKKDYERAEKAKAKAHVHELGSVEEVVKTDYTITLEKGMEIESMSLDFDEIDKMKALQTKLDKEYAKAKEAYDNVVLDIERQRQADAMALALGEEDGANGCAPVPNCAQPPSAPALPPPPKRTALGTENLPIVIRARYKLSPQQSVSEKTEVERRFVPGKAICQPQCCPRCGDVNCTDTDCCPHHSTGSRQPSQRIGREPYSAPASNEAASGKQRVLNSDRARTDPLNLEASKDFMADGGVFDGQLESISLIDVRD